MKSDSTRSIGSAAGAAAAAQARTPGRRELVRVQDLARSRQLLRQGTVDRTLQGKRAERVEVQRLERVVRTHNVDQNVVSRLANTLVVRELQTRLSSDLYQGAKGLTHLDATRQKSPSYERLRAFLRLHGFQAPAAKAAARLYKRAQVAVAAGLGDVGMFGEPHLSPAVRSARMHRVIGLHYLRVPPVQRDDEKLFDPRSYRPDDGTTEDPSGRGREIRIPYESVPPSPRLKNRRY